MQPAVDEIATLADGINDLDAHEHSAALRSIWTILKVAADLDEVEADSVETAAEMVERHLVLSDRRDGATILPA